MLSWNKVNFTDTRSRTWLLHGELTALQFKKKKNQQTSVYQPMKLLLLIYGHILNIIPLYFFISHCTWSDTFK